MANLYTLSFTTVICLVVLVNLSNALTILPCDQYECHGKVPNCASKIFKEYVSTWIILCIQISLQQGSTLSKTFSIPYQKTLFMMFVITCHHIKNSPSFMTDEVFFRCSFQCENENELGQTPHSWVTHS